MKVNYLFKRKSKPIVYEGKDTEQYKKMRNKWIRLAAISFILPLIFAVVVSYYNGKLNIKELFGDGEILLSLFSLTVPMLFDIFEIKNHNDDNITRIFFWPLIIICVQVLLYCMTRIDSSKYKEIKSIIMSMFMLIASWVDCSCAIKIMYKHCNSDDGGKK